MNNLSIFIKRAEEYQDEKFITEVFSKKQIGNVSNVTFIKKHNNYTSYNGVIVNFKSWNDNNYVKQLIDEMMASEDGTIKFYFSDHNYWFINIHKLSKQIIENNVLDDSLTTEDNLKKLINDVKTNNVKLHYLQKKQERMERRIMDYENNYMKNHLSNVTLQVQLQEQKDEQNYIINQKNKEIDELKKQLAFLTKDNKKVMDINFDERTIKN